MIDRKCTSLEGSSSSLERHPKLGLEVYTEQIAVPAVLQAATSVCSSWLLKVGRLMILHFAVKSFSASVSYGSQSCLWWCFFVVVLQWVGFCLDSFCLR